MMTKINFDPVQLGELEFGWWKAHNEHNKPKLLELLIQQNMQMYRFSQDEASKAVKKVFEAVGYHDIRNWDQAIDSMTEYYKLVKIKTKLEFDPKVVGKLEIGWWKIHDELELNKDKRKLAGAFVSLYSALFNIPPDRLKIVGTLRAEATREHDIAEDPMTKQDKVDKHWDNARRFLVDGYKELIKVMNAK